MRSALGATALSTVFLLAACGGDPEPKFGPEPSAEPSVSSSPSAATEPEAWEEKTDAGAVAFVEHWIDEFNAMRETGETVAVANLSTRSCETCSNFVRYTTDLFDAGGEIETAGWSVIAVSQPAEAGSDRPVLSVRVDQAPQVLRESSAAEPQRFSGGKANFVAHLKWSGQGWRMDRLDAA